MKENKLTPEEIIKALECCAGESPNCSDCPANKYEAGKCFDIVKVQAVAVMNSQQAEIEKLKRVISHLEGVCESTPDKVRAEAIKEFAERLKNLNRFSNQPDRYYIDCLVKEMVGEQE